MVQMKKIGVVAIFCLSFAVGSTAVAGDTWNILDPTVRDESKEASAQILDAAADIFSGLANAERENKLSANRFFDAAKRLQISADSFERLAASDFGKKPFVTERSEAAFVVYQWYASGDMTPVKAEAEVTAGDILLRAAAEARTLSGLVVASFEKEDYPNIYRTKQIIDRYASFLSIGSSAADAFSRIK